MPIFECTTEEGGKPRMVRAPSAALARRHIVNAKAISGDRMADLLADEVTLEIYSPDGTDDEPETPPAPNAVVEEQPQTRNRKSAPAGAE